MIKLRAEKWLNCQCCDDIYEYTKKKKKYINQTSQTKNIREVGLNRGFHPDLLPCSVADADRLGFLQVIKD